MKTISKELQTLLQLVPEVEIRRALDIIANQDHYLARCYPTPVQSAYATPRFKLWEGCTSKAQHQGRRFRRIIKKMVPDESGKNNYREEFCLEIIDPNTMSKTDKEFWQNGDKIWSWAEYLRGAKPEEICIFVGGKKSEFIDWVKAVCRGEEQCTFAGDITGDWTPRQDRVLWLMYESRLQFNTASRLLGRHRYDIRVRLIHLKNEKQKGR